MSKSKEKVDKLIVNILILYQGKVAKSYADPLSSRLNNKDLGGNYKYKANQVGFHEDDSSKYILTIFLNDLVWADGAVAIIGPDKRMSSKTGNIWYEIGWWHAKKSPENLLICTLEDKDVDVITDYNGKIVPRFSNNDDLLSTVLSHIHKVGDAIYKIEEYKNRDFDENDNYSMNLKIFDTLGHKHYPIHGVYNCEHLILRGDKNTIDCDYRIKSIHFISELIRMGEKDRETSELMNCFYQIARYANETIRAEERIYHRNDKQHDIIDRRYNRQDKYDRMIEWIYELIRKMKQFFELSLNSDLDIKKNLWNELAFYMEYRVDIAITYFEFLKGLQLYLSNLKTLKNRINDFINWMENLTNDKFDYHKSNFYQEGINLGDKSKDEANDIRFFSIIAENMAQLLDYFSCEYFRKCQEIIFENIDSENPFIDIRNTFKKIVEALPHNQKECLYPKIWPQNKGVHSD